MTSTIQLVNSTLLLACGLGAALLCKPNRAIAALLGTLVLAFFLLAAAFIAADQFTGHGIDQAVLYHMSYGLEGAGYADYAKLIISITALVAVGVGSAVGTAMLLNGRKGATRLWPTRWLSVLLMSGACLLNPATRDLFALFGREAFGTTVDDANSPSFDAFYRAPDLGPEPRARRNLIFIYAEGLEHTYFDESLFPGLIVHMRELERIATSFTNITQTEGATFTIGGMVGSQCGIPLLTSSGGNSMSGMKRFLPNAVCLGDLLSARGYELAYIGGASLRFAGKGAFLNAHGFRAAQGREELQSQLRDREYQSPWGLYDDSLLDIAYDKFLSLASGQSNFGLFLLTLDTHAPDGHLSDAVKDVRYGSGQTAMLNAVAGSDRLLTAFVQRVLSSPQGKDTLLVICSDHLAMENGASRQLDAGRRRNLFFIIDPHDPKPAEVVTPGTTLDVGATVLHALGYQSNLGLGRSLLGTEPTLRQALPNLSSAIRDWRQDLSRFWGMSELNSLKISAKEREVEAGGTSLRFPALITFDSSFHAELFFEFDNTKQLIDYVAELEEGTPFVWVGPCDQQNGYVQASDNALAGDCLIAGKRGARPVLVSSIEDSTYLSKSNLRDVLASPIETGLYELQGLALLEAQLPAGLGPLLRSMPNGAKFYHSKGRVAQRIQRYIELAKLVDRNISVIRTPPRDSEFYFGSTDLRRVKKARNYEVTRVAFGDDFLSVLRRYEEDLVILAAKDDARSKLSARTIGYLQSLGIDLTRLKFRGSFAAVLEGRRLLAAEVNNEGPVVLASQELSQRGITRVESAGYGSGNYSRIVVDGKDLSKNERGINIVVVERYGGQRLALNVDTAVSENVNVDLFKATPRR